jgi:ribonucleoside-diphosphate reductase alpha chain
MVRRDVPRKLYAQVWPSSRDENMNSATLTSLVDATHYVPVGIREVRSAGEAHTYDIEVRDGSMFVAEGYLVHNTAMISLFDYDDDEMRLCKSGDFERDNSQRWNANNSAIWNHDDLTQTEFVRRFLEMVDSGRGEPGIFNRQASLDMRPERRQAAEFGTNPCAEIVLRPWEFCNLTAAVARAEDTFESLRDKVEVATLIGTIQSLATSFPGLRPIWQHNCEEERLLGVDITGQMDSPAVQDAEVKARLREIAIATNRQAAQALGINHSAAITCVKPSGNSSQLLDCASGLHARWAPYYIRNIRVASSSPLFKVLRDAGAPMDPENGQSPETATTWVVHFPVKSPEGAITRNDRSAVEQCEFWLQNKLHWTEHNPSTTITYRPEEVIDLMKWIWEHRDVIGGMAFLPAFDANYAQMPYVEVTREEYERLAASFPEIDFSKIYRYEDKDLTNAAQEMACVAGSCELDL